MKARDVHVADERRVAMALVLMLAAAVCFVFSAGAWFIDRSVWLQIFVALFWGVPGMAAAVIAWRFLRSGRRSTQ